MKNELNKITEELYTVFEKYKLDIVKFEENSCPCCFDKKAKKELFSRPLKNITENDIITYSESAISTIGSIDDYKHFLPRILDLLQDETSLDLIGSFICFEKLNYAEWETWPSEEQEIIEYYLSALWSNKINTENISQEYLIDIMTITSRYIGIEYCLKEILNSNANSALDLILNSVINGFDYNIQDRESLISWLYAESVLKKLEYIFFKTNDYERSNKISTAYTILENKYPITFY